MDRRNFLKSLGAAGILPAIPLPAIATPAAAVMPAAAPAFTAHTYQWAEMIVRAHNKCNLGLLQRSLRIDATAAAALKETLIKNGVVSALPNVYGIHTATQPLYEGAFMNVSDAAELASEAAEKMSDLLDDQLSGGSSSVAKNESEISDLEEPDESNPEFVESIHEEDEELIAKPEDVAETGDVATENTSDFADPRERLKDAPPEFA